MGEVQLNADRTVETINLVLEHSRSHSQRRDAIRKGLSLRDKWKGKRIGRGKGGRRRQTSSVLLNRAQSLGNGHGNGDCMMTGSRGRGAEERAAAAAAREGPEPREVMEEVEA